MSPSKSASKWACLSVFGLSLLLTPTAQALPGQRLEELVAHANQRGWKVEPQSFEAGSLYGFQVQDWKRVRGRTVYEHRGLRFRPKLDLRVDFEVLEYSVDFAYADDDLVTAEAIWREYVAAFYGPELGKEILTSRPLKQVVARTRWNGQGLRHRLAVVVGEKWAYLTHITAPYTDTTFKTLDLQGSMTGKVQVYPVAQFARALRELNGYSWLEND
jgi:hypothetical protein